MPDTIDLPETKPYRVSIAGAIYNRHKEDIGADGKIVEVVVRELALFGQEIELTEREAVRLTKLNAVKPADAPLSYEEMNEGQLGDLAKERGVDVRGSGAEGAVLKEDLINAHLIYDQARGGAVGAPPAAVPAGQGGFDAAAYVEDHNADDVVAYAEQNPGSADALLAAEQARENPRKGVVEALS